MPGLRIATLDVVTQVASGHIARLVSHRTLVGHDRFHCEALNLAVARAEGRGRLPDHSLGVELRKKTGRNNQRATQHRRRTGYDFLLGLEFSDAAFKTIRKHIGTLACLRSADATAALAGVFLRLEFHRIRIPIVDFLGEALVNLYRIVNPRLQ